jgi:hypothetical protein
MYIDCRGDFTYLPLLRRTVTRRGFYIFATLTKDSHSKVILRIAATNLPLLFEISFTIALFVDVARQLGHFCSRGTQVARANMDWNTKWPKYPCYLLLPPLKFSSCILACHGGRPPSRERGGGGPATSLGDLEDSMLTARRGGHDTLNGLQRALAMGTGGTPAMGRRHAGH